MAAGAVFSVAVYAWAVAVALPGERIEALIRETQDPADPAEPAETPA